MATTAEFIQQSWSLRPPHVHLLWWRQLGVSPHRVAQRKARMLGRLWRSLRLVRLLGSGRRVTTSNLPCRAGPWYGTQILLQISYLTLTQLFQGYRNHGLEVWIAQSCSIDGQKAWLSCSETTWAKLSLSPTIEHLHDVARRLWVRAVLLAISHRADWCIADQLFWLFPAKWGRFDRVLTRINRLSFDQLLTTTLWSVSLHSLF